MRVYHPLLIPRDGGSQFSYSSRIFLATTPDKNYDPTHPNYSSPYLCQCERLSRVAELYGQMFKNKGAKYGDKIHKRATLPSKLFLNI
ncbi:hypothetical protein ABKN59_005701 [Abortiporus biennis]